MPYTIRFRGQWYWDDMHGSCKVACMHAPNLDVLPPRDVLARGNPTEVDSTSISPGWVRLCNNVIHASPSHFVAVTITTVAREILHTFNQTVAYPSHPIPAFQAPVCPLAGLCSSSPGAPCRPPLHLPLPRESQTARPPRPQPSTAAPHGLRRPHQRRYDARRV